MSILEVKNVSIRYMTGDFKEIGLKEFVMRKLKNNYKVVIFGQIVMLPFLSKKGTCWALSAPMVRASRRC